jgi:carboxymethylenebutenolidase
MRKGMTEQKLEISVDGRIVEALFFKPDDVGTFPGLVFYTDIWGIRPANIGMARRLADKGFAVLMPNVFFRYSKITPDGFEPDDPAQIMPRLHQLFVTETRAQMKSDGAVYVDFLLAQTGVAPGKVGVVGYCFTGQMAVLTAAAAPDKVAAAASFHGGFLVSDDADSPHRQLGPIRARLYFGHAVEDNTATPEQVATLEAALRDWHGAFESEFYAGALHGWTVPGRDVYNELQAERAFEKLVELLKGSLE